MFERYTERARHAIVLSQDEARGLRHQEIGTEHLLLGLLREEQGVASRVLEFLDLEIGDLRERVVSFWPKGLEMMVGKIPFTPEAKKVLELSLREALCLGHNYIGTEHILLGIVRHDEGGATRVFDSYGIEGREVREQVVRLVSGPTGYKREAKPLPRLVSPFVRSMRDVADYLFLSTEPEPEELPRFETGAGRPIGETTPQRLRRLAQEIEDRDRAIENLRLLLAQYKGME